MEIVKNDSNLNLMDVERVSVHAAQHRRHVLRHAGELAPRLERAVGGGHRDAAGRS